MCPEPARGPVRRGAVLGGGRDAAGPGSPREIRAAGVPAGLTLLLQAQGEAASHQQIDDVLNEIDSNHNGQVEVEEYLQVRTVFCASRCSSRFLACVNIPILS